MTNGLVHTNLLSYGASANTQQYQNLVRSVLQSSSLFDGLASLGEMSNDCSQWCDGHEVGAFCCLIAIFVLVVERGQQLFCLRIGREDFFGLFAFVGAYERLPQS